jgi:hypothetical protein
VLPVRVMCVNVLYADAFMCFKLQCNCTELNVLQKTIQGAQPFVSWVFRWSSPLYHGVASRYLEMKLKQHALAQSTLNLRVCCVEHNIWITLWM